MAEQQRTQGITHRDYPMLCRQATHWQETYAGGEAYKRSRDEFGDPIIPQYSHEDDKQHAARLSATPVFNLADDLVAKRVGEVFAQPIARPALGSGDRPGNELFRDFMADVDGRGTSMSAWMRARAREGLIVHRVYLGVDMPPKAKLQGDAAPATRADVLQRRELRPRLVWADMRNVVDWAPDEGPLERITIRYEERRKASFLESESVSVCFVEWTAAAWRKYREETAPGGSKRLVLEDEGINELGRVPFVVLELLPRTSYVGRIAPLVKSATRTASHMEAEEVACVFTLAVITGATPEQIGKTPAGPGSALVLANDQAGIQTWSHDPAAMETLRRNLQMKLAEAVRRAESANGVESMQPQSGVAHAYEFKGLQALLQSIAHSLERAENGLIELWALAMGVDDDGLASSTYPQEFDVLSDEALFERLKWFVETVSLPVTIKRGVLHELVSMQFPIDDEKTRAMHEEIDRWSPSAGAQFLSDGLRFAARQPAPGPPPGFGTNLLSGVDPRTTEIPR